MKKLRRDYIQREVFRHNGHLGRIDMARKSFGVIVDSKQTTGEAKQIARRIMKDLDLLRVAVKVRIDPPEAFK